jgi:hypothetical protein
MLCLPPVPSTVETAATSAAAVKTATASTIGTPPTAGSGPISAKLTTAEGAVVGTESGTRRYMAATDAFSGAAANRASAFAGAFSSSATAGTSLSPGLDPVLSGCQLTLNLVRRRSVIRGASAMLWVVLPPVL